MTTLGGIQDLFMIAFIHHRDGENVNFTALLTKRVKRASNLVELGCQGHKQSLAHPIYYFLWP